MLSVTGLNHFYYVRDFTDMRCKHSRVLSIIRERLHRETWCKVRKYDHYKKCYIWVLVNKAQKTAIFFYENGSRGRDVLTDFLGDAELKSIMSDGYNAYVFIGNELKSARFKYGSDAGAGMAATYHSMIGTVKLHGSSVWNFIGTFFKKIFNGCRDYVNMVPDKITLATSQC